MAWSIVIVLTLVARVALVIALGRAGTGDYESGQRTPQRDEPEAPHPLAGA
ncbi:hypothetical protein [Blastococcus sp. SYSU D01042]